MADIIPTGGLPYCDTESGTFDHTYDNNTGTSWDTYDTNCLLKWTWGTPQTIAGVKIWSYFYWTGATSTSATIQSIWAINADGSTTLLKSNVYWHPTQNTWSTIEVPTTNNCIGIQISINNPGSTLVNITELHGVSGTPLTASATMTACTGVAGSTVTANLQWSGASSYNGDYAYGYMVNPSGNICAGPYYYTASPSGPSVFISCLGNVSGIYTAHLFVYTSSSGTTIEKTATCTIGTGYTLTLTINPSSAQTAGCWVLIEDASGNRCASYTCLFPAGTVLHLTAVPLSGWKWSSWSGTNNNSANPTTVTMSANKSVTCNFTAIPMTYTTVSYLYDTYGCPETAPPAKNWFSPNETVGAWLRLDWAGHHWLGQELAWAWYHDGVLIWNDSTVLENWYDWIYWCIGASPGVGTGYINWYLDGVYVCRTNYHVTYAGTWCDMINENCVFHPGPYQQNQQNVTIATLRIRNLGDTAGTAQWKCFVYPNNVGGTQQMAASGTTGTILSQGNTYADVVINIPNVSGNIPFGVKVWGTGESEPVNPTLEWVA